MAFDILILGGIVVDGSGGPGYRADLGVSGDSIEVEIGCAVKLVALNLGIWLNRLFGRPDLALATLFNR